MKVVCGMCTSMCKGLQSSGTLWPNGERLRVLSAHTVSQTLLAFLSCLTLSILQKRFFWWSQSLSLQFSFHNIAKILQQSQDTLEKCTRNFKENSMLNFYFIFYYCPKVIVCSEKETDFFFLSSLAFWWGLHFMSIRKGNFPEKKILSLPGKKRYPWGSPVLGFQRWLL